MNSGIAAGFGDNCSVSFKNLNTRSQENLLDAATKIAKHKQRKENTCIYLTLSWKRSLSCRNRSNDLRPPSYHDRVNPFSHKRSISHCVISVQIRSFFWSVFSRIRTKCGLSVFSRSVGKYGPEKTPYLDTFQEVSVPPEHFRKTLIENILTTASFHMDGAVLKIY